jgi:hypothetical protein
VRYLLLLALLLSVPTSLRAQWRIALLAGSASSHGDARDDTDPAHPEIRADAPATISAALARERGPWRVAVELHHTSADLAEISAASAVTTRSVLKAWGAAIEWSRRIAGDGDTPALSVAVGAGIDRWTFDLDESSPRWRASARGAIEAEIPISAAWRAVIRSQAAVGPSVFKPDELPDGFVQRMAVRIGLVLGVALAIRP